MPDWKSALPPEVRGVILRNQARKEIIETISGDNTLSDTMTPDATRLLREMEWIDMDSVRAAIKKII